MTNAINKEEKQIVATKGKSLIEEMAEQYHLDSATFLATLKSTIMSPSKIGIDREVTTEELAMFLMTAKKYNLNPFIKEIYAFNTKRGGIVPIVSIDGWIAIAERRTDYRGFTLTYSDKMIKDLEGQKVPCYEWCEITIRKTDNKSITIREYLDEVYVPPKGQNKFDGPWQTHTKRMLRHKTIIQGLRIALGISGIYDEDEAHRIVDAIDVPFLPANTPPPVTLKSLKNGNNNSKEEQKHQDTLHMNIKDSLEAFAKQKERVGEKAYYEILNAIGKKHANEIKDRRGKELIYDELLNLPDNVIEREPGEEG